MIHDRDNQTGDAICFLRGLVVVTALTHQQARSTHQGDGGGGAEQCERRTRKSKVTSVHVLMDGPLSLAQSSHE